VSGAEHPNAARVRRVFAAFGKDAMAISAALARDIVWRVPGHTVMSGEYRGRREVVEFLRRTDDDWAVAIYRATGSRNGIDLDVDQAFVIRCREDGLWQEVTAVPLHAAFERFWA
jgi:ketosteroid isomerase-like protein